MNCYLAFCYFKQVPALVLLVKADNENQAVMYAREFCRDKVFDEQYKEPLRVGVQDINKSIDRLLQSQNQALHVGSL